MVMFMLKQGFAALLFVAASLLPLSAGAQENDALTPAQQQAVKNLVRSTLIENPEIIAEAIDALREREMLSAEAEAKKALVSRKDDIFNNPTSPILGNPNGDVTIVEFFDYRCPYCKSLATVLFDTLASDGKIKLIMKELPVLGPESELGAKAALAAHIQGRYFDFHRALMTLKGPLNEAAIMKIAADLKLDVEKLKIDMASPEIEKTLAANIDLAHALGLRGAPALVIGDQIIPGAVTQQALKQLILQNRKK